MPWAFPGPVDDAVIAALPFYEAQALLDGTPERTSRRIAMCEWHGTDPVSGDPSIGSFCLLNDDGPLADWVGERIRVTYRGRAVIAYALRTAQLDEDMSVTRRLYMALANQSDTSIQVLAEPLI